MLSRIKSLLIFAFPIMLGNLGQMLIGAGDVFVAARHGASTLAAISIANAIMTAVFLVGLGLLFSISPVLSQKRGQGQDIDKYFKINLLYAFVLSIVFGLLSLIPIPLIPYIGFEKKLVPYIQDYLFICSFSFVGAYIYQCLKEFLQVYEKVFFANLVSIAAIFLNLLLCWLFVFGNGVIPSLGINGLAIASLIVRFAMGAALLCYCCKFFKAKMFVDKSYLSELFRMGYPLSLSLLLEISAFSMTTLIAGKINTIQVATHNIVLTFASITFMVPLSISNALSVRVGYAYGAKNYRDIIENMSAGIIASLFFMSIFALMFFTMPQALIGFFSTDRSIILTGSSLLFIVALFQIFDGMQVTLSGALRGLGLTKPIMATMLVSYWLIGIPVGVYLSFVRKWQIYGLWTGLAVALLACALIFSLFLQKRLIKVKASLANHSSHNEAVELVKN